MPNVTLTCLVSSNTNIRYDIPDECVLLSDWRDALIPDNIDGVIIATPPANHMEIAEFAMKQCLPVLVEKPLTMDLSEAERLMVLATKLGAVITVNHTHLFHPAYRKLKKLVKSSGMIGDIYSKSGNWGPFRSDTPVLLDWGAHDIAMCIDIHEELPETISAKLLQKRVTQQGLGETILIRLGFPSGSKAEIIISNILEVKKKAFKVETKAGNFIYDSVGSFPLIHEKKNKSKDSNKNYANNISVQGTAPLSVVVDEFCDRILQNNKKLDDLILGLNVVKVLDKLSHCLAVS